MRRQTRSGKIMRRILRKIAAGEEDSIGDITTLADPTVSAKVSGGAQCALPCQHQSCGRTADFIHPDVPFAGRGCSDREVQSSALILRPERQCKVRVPLLVLSIY